ncbi:hypothetical protein JCM11251_005573 [Rhodosporidiobolus azoricus]
MSYTPSPHKSYPAGASSALPPLVPTPPSRSGSFSSTPGSEQPVASGSRAQNGLPGSTARAKNYQPVKTGEGNLRRSAKACQFCRKGKARCDGLEHYPCRRCRDGGIECVFEGMTAEESKQRAEVAQEEKRRTTGYLNSSSPSNDKHSLSSRNSTIASPPTTDLSQLEQRLQRMEAELSGLRSKTDQHGLKLADLDQRTSSRGGESRAVSEAIDHRHSRFASVASKPEFEVLEREAFDLFMEMYAPLAPYIDPRQDTYDDLRTRSPLLLHVVVAVASRLHENREFVEYHRSRALKYMRETLYAERPLTLDDLKGTLAWNAWLGKGAPPGHSLSLALQLDLPKALERLLASIAGPAEEATRAFEQHMPGIRSYLTLYAQDLWLSVATGRRSLVTIDISVTSSRLLLNFASLRPPDARIIAQSELVTILGVVQESVLKMERQPAQTMHLVQQANMHLDTWISTWRAYAESQDAPTCRYILASFSVLLQGGRFYINSGWGLRDISKADELMPEHLGYLRTALDAAVRIQGIHPAQKIAHSAEFTLITLSSAALFLLKMIKLAPHAFSPLHCSSYPSFSALASTPSNIPYDANASSPDISASPISFSTPSISQALDAARHSAKLLSNAPARQRSYAQAVEAALSKLESELATLPSAAGLVSGLAKRPRDEAEEGSEARPPRPPPVPSADNGTAALASLAALPPVPLIQSTTTPGDGQADANNLAMAAATSSGADPGADFGLWSGANDFGAGLDAASEGLLAPVGELDEATIASLIGTESFWSWSSSLPGESIQPFIS